MSPGGSCQEIGVLKSYALPPCQLLLPRPSTPGSQHTVLHVHLDRWPIRRLAHPNVQVFTFPRFEEHDIIAIIELSELVQLV